MSSAPTSSTSTTRDGALASNSCATTASTGSTISRLSALALARMSRAVSHQVVLGQRLADRLALREQERVGHGAADDQHVDLGDQVAEQSSLVDTLAPPTMAATGRSGSSSALSKRLEFRLHGAAGIGGQHVAEAFGRGMGAVRGREGVVDIDIAELGQRADEVGIVLFLARVEAGVLQQRMSPGFMAATALLGRLADAVVGERDRPLEDVRDAAGDRLQRVLRDRACPSAGRNATAGSPCRPCRQSR